MNKIMYFLILVLFSSCGDSVKKNAGKKGLLSICGNGVLDGGEKCDSAITSGNDGACQETCAAPACSTATLIGSRETCDAECIVAPIACQDDDGCCPLGCDSQSDTDCSNTCGNDVVETPELCDGDDCPSQCTSGEVCAISVLKGDAQNCSARCEVDAIEICVDGDGCCPPNCSADTDSDCENATTCGNGVIEGAESCDGNCPESCSDNDACSTDQLVGAAQTCTARCVFEAIDACISDDGCCPQGCNADTDSDCDPQCGNGMIDGDEICDGNCPSTCNDAQVCTSDKLLGSPTTCNSECRFTTITRCVNGDGCCPNNCEFANDNDCACIPDTCNALGLECGNHSDGCSGMLNCGNCTSGTCNNAGLCIGGMDGAVGDTCSDLNDCMDGGGFGGTTCLMEPGGYCSSVCISLVGLCPAGSACLDDVGGVGTGLCRKDCVNSNDCRPFYSCVDGLSGVGAVRVCVPN